MYIEQHLSALSQIAGDVKCSEYIRWFRQCIAGLHHMRYVTTRKEINKKIVRVRKTASNKELSTISQRIHLYTQNGIMKRTQHKHTLRHLRIHISSVQRTRSYPPLVREQHNHNTPT